MKADMFTNEARAIQALLILLLMTFGSVAAQGQRAPDEAAVEQIAPRTDDSTKAVQELAIMQAELQTLRSFQDRLLMTVYWALGTVASIAFLLVGFGWFANFRIYERDKDALGRELHTLVDQRLHELKSSLEAQTSEATSDLSASQSQQHEGLRKEIDGRLSEEMKSTKSLISASERNEADCRKDLETEFRRLKVDFLELDRDRCRAEGNLPTALRCSVKILDEAIRMQFDWQVSRALDSISFDLQNLRSKGQTLEAFRRAELIASLDMVHGPNSQLAAKIKEGL
jgi:hypothetical protein